MKTNRSEKGQAFVLIIVAIVAIFGFAALAVDGGNVYAERRRAQNAADASALAAASAKQQGKNWSTAALNLAATNGFTNDGTRSTVKVFNPPISGPYKSVKDKNDYFQVIIETKVDPIFSHFVFSGDGKQTVEAVVRYKAETSPMSGNAIWGLKKGGYSTVFNGTADILVNGGNVYSSGNVTKNASGTGTVTVTNGGIVSVGNWIGGYEGVYAEDVTNGAEMLSAPKFDQPYCPPKSPSGYSHEVANGVNYYRRKGSMITGANLVLEPNSVHCIDGDLVINGSDLLVGHRVLLVFLDGDLVNNGNAGTDLTRMDSIIDKNGVEYGGMLIWAGNSSSIYLGGTSNSYLEGTVYAPKATCDIGGTNESSAIYSAFICYDFKFHGTATIRIEYDPKQQAHEPETIGVKQ